MIKRHLIPKIHQATGRRYLALESAMDSMTPEALRDLQRLIGDVQSTEKDRLGGVAARMGIPRGVLR